MKKVLIFALLSALVSGVVDAKPGGGGFGGGGRSFSSPSHSFSVPSAKGSFSAPRASPTIVQKGSFSAPHTAPTISQKGSFSAPRTAPSAPARTTSTTTVSRTTVRNYSYGGRYVSPGGYYGGWGMGYGYNNGFLTGLIIGNMMHPMGTVMYTGPGMYSNNAVLYPSGQVVDQNGYQVGTYQNGQFTPVQNGAMVAQPVPADANGQVVQPPQQPAAVEKPIMGFFEVIAYLFGGITIAVLFVILLGMI